MLCPRADQTPVSAGVLVLRVLALRSSLASLLLLTSRAPPMRLYDIAMRAMRVLVNLYFVEVRASGRSRVPVRGPLILASNHPGSILDAIVLSAQVPRRIRYLAKSGLFAHPIMATLFRSLGAIPVYRPDEAADYAQRNLSMYKQVFDCLGQGGCIGIFPEGRNSPRAQVAEVRTGVARMALGAEAHSGWKLGLVIVPVGVNFEHRELLMSDVLLRFGQPIAVADYKSRYSDGPEAAVRELTNRIQAALRRQALHLNDRRLEQLVNDLAAVCGPELTPPADTVEAGPPLGNRFKRALWRMLSWYHRSSRQAGYALEGRILSRQYIAQVLSRAVESAPRQVDALRSHVERYKDHLGQTNLRLAAAGSLAEPVKEKLLRLRMTLFAVLMAPVALFGLVHNIVPYLFIKFVPRAFVDPAIRAFAYFGIGAIAFTASYGLIGYWLSQQALSIPQTLTYLAALPPTGFAALGYRRTIVVYRNKILLRTALWNNVELIRLLQHERQALLGRFRALAQHFD